MKSIGKQTLAVVLVFAFLPFAVPGAEASHQFCQPTADDEFHGSYAGTLNGAGDIFSLYWDKPSATGAQWVDVAGTLGDVDIYIYNGDCSELICDGSSGYTVPALLSEDRCDSRIWNGGFQIAIRLFSSTVGQAQFEVTTTPA